MYSVSMVRGIFQLAGCVKSVYDQGSSPLNLLVEAMREFVQNNHVRLARKKTMKFESRGNEGPGSCLDEVFNHQLFPKMTMRC